MKYERAQRDDITLVVFANEVYVSIKSGLFVYFTGNVYYMEMPSQLLI